VKLLNYTIPELNKMYPGANDITGMETVDLTFSTDAAYVKRFTSSVSRTTSKPFVHGAKNPAISKATWEAAVRAAFGKDGDNYLAPQVHASPKFITKEAGLRPMSLFNLRRVKQFLIEYTKGFARDNKTPKGVVMTFGGWVKSCPAPQRMLSCDDDPTRSKCPGQPCKGGFILPLEDINMYFINNHLVQPLTKYCKGQEDPKITDPEEREAASRCSFVELLGDSNGNPKRESTYFISHGWGASFFDFVNTVESHAALHEHTDPKAVHYWVCTFANNQHFVEVGDVSKNVETVPFAVAIKHAKGVLAIQDDIVPELLTPARIWCVFELFYAQHKAKVPLEIGCAGGEILGTGADIKQLPLRAEKQSKPNCNCALVNMFGSFSIETQSKVSVEKDKTDIASYMSASSVTFESFSKNYINKLLDVESTKCSDFQIIKTFDMKRRMSNAARKDESPAKGQAGKKGKSPAAGQAGKKGKSSAAGKKGKKK